MKKIYLLTLLVLISLTWACTDKSADLTGGINIEEVAASSVAPQAKADQMMQALTHFFKHMVTVKDDKEAIEAMNTFSTDHGPAMQKIAKEFGDWMQKANETELSQMQQEMLSKPYFRELDVSLDSLGNRMQSNEEFQKAMTQLMQLTVSEPTGEQPDMEMK